MPRRSTSAARRTPRRSARRSSRSRPTTSSTGRSGRRTSSPTRRIRCRRTGARSCTARRPPARARGSCAARGSSGRRARTSCARCSRSAASATRSPSSTTSAARRPTSAHLAAAVRELLELPPGLWHLAAEGDCTWAEFAEAIFEEAGHRLPRAAHHDRGARPAGAAPGVLGAAQRAPGAPELPHWRDGLRACLDRLP